MLTQQFSLSSFISYHGQECVICGTSYIPEVDSLGRQHLTPLNVINQNLNSSRAETPSSNMQVIPTVPDAVTQTSHDVTSRFNASSLPRQIKGMVSSQADHVVRQSDAFLRKDRGMETLRALEESSKSLQSALRTLSARLVSGRLQMEGPTCYQIILIQQRHRYLI